MNERCENYMSNQQADIVANGQEDYVLGADVDELVRLGFQHRVWAEYAFALWERAGFAPGQTVLDLGCGPGFATMDIASIVGSSGRVIAVEKSDRFVEHLRTMVATHDLRHVDVVHTDIMDMAIDAGSVDRAYERWVLCFVDDPETVVRKVADSLRPGGVFAVQDYFNYISLTLAPRSPAMDRVVQAVDESFRKFGGDPDIAGRLPKMMQDCGLEVQEIRPILRVARPGSALWHWPTTFFENYLPKLVDMGMLSIEECEAFNSDWARASKDPNAFLCTPPVYDIIAVKPA